MKRLFSLFFLLWLLIGCKQKQQIADTIFIKGATLINLQNEEGQYYDIPNGFIHFKANEIIALGSFDDNTIIPASARIIDASGKFILPGLIDGFATLNNQSQANAYLAKGVTTIVGVDGGRRGWFYPNAKPSPDFYRLESVGDENKSDSAHIEDLRDLHKEGYKIALFKYQLRPNQVRLLHEEAKKLGMGTIGELGHTSYAEGIDIGLDAFVHTTRYSKDVAPKIMREAVADEPFSDDLNSSKWKYYKYLASLDTSNAELHKHAQKLTSGRTFLIPTFSLLYADLPEHKNPWNDLVAKVLNPADINNPVDENTGKHLYSTEVQDNYTAMAVQQLKIEQVYYTKGCKYLAGSATDVWGTMPGISLHSELEILHRIGLNNRELIATTTSNFWKAYGWKTGKLQKDFEADLLVLDKNPLGNLEDLNSISLLFNNGEEVDLGKLMELPYDKSLSDGQIISRKDFDPYANPSIKTLIFELGTNNIKSEYSYLEKIKIEEVYYMSDGLRVKAFIAYPKGSEKLPAIIYNHGGNREFSKISPTRVVDILARMASWGYVTIGSQYRGIDGGDGQEEFGGEDVNDVLNLIPLLENMPQADADKIGMFGKSRGGMMTYLSMMKTDKIKSAVVIGGVADLEMMNRNRPDVMEKMVFMQLMTNYWMNKDELLRDRSAIKRVKEISKTCPILLIHGTADWRVSPMQSINLATAMQHEKIPYRLVMMEGADHGLTEFKEESNYMIKEWFDRFLIQKEELPKLETHGN